MPLKLGMWYAPQTMKQARCCNKTHCRESTSRANFPRSFWGYSSAKWENVLGKKKGMDSINRISKPEQLKKVTEGQAHRATRTDGRGQPWNFRELMIREESDNNWDNNKGTWFKNKKEQKYQKQAYTHNKILMNIFI